jgi:hypothetical protein
MRKGITLLTVLLLPITIYLIFAISTIHYVPVPHFGPRTARVVVDAKGRSKKDTVYQTIGAFEYLSNRGLLKSDSIKKHMYIACLIQQDSIHNGYNCAALKAYYKVNKGELDTLHFVFFYHRQTDSIKPSPDFADTLGLRKEYTVSFYPDKNDLVYLREANYFIADPRLKKQPWKTGNELVLIDTKGCIRGYYDGRWAPDITHMIEDIKHIKFHDESAGMEKKYTPTKKSTPLPN